MKLLTAAIADLPVQYGMGPSRHSSSGSQSSGVTLHTSPGPQVINYAHTHRYQSINQLSPVSTTRVDGPS